MAEALLLLPGATVATSATLAVPPSATNSPAMSRASSTALGSAPTTPVTGRAGAGIITPFKSVQQVLPMMSSCFLKEQ